ncbi:MAG: hypothetical protein QNJ98_01260 [Planctomycetota bacterium]|nr:hypothetical protein [Planctomycetota bacterium]
MSPIRSLCLCVLVSTSLALAACGGGGGGGGGPAVDQLGVAPTETLVVTNLDDNGPGSLRQAVNDALPGAWIVFSELLAPGTITLLNEIPIDKPVAIGGLAGDGSRFQLDGDNAKRIFNVWPGAHLWLNDLVLLNGQETDGGAIYVEEAQLTVHRTHFAGHDGLDGSGGAINARDSDVKVFDSSFIANSALSAGAIAAFESQLRVTRSSFFLNTATGGGAGAIGLRNSSATIVNTSVINNMAVVSAFATGGGISIVTKNPGQQASLRVFSSTFTGNQAALNGGGISAIEQDGSPVYVEVYRSILAENGGGPEPDFATYGGVTVASGQNIVGVGDNLHLWNGIGGNVVGDAFSPVDPLLGPVVGDPLARMYRVPLELSPAASALAGGTVFGPEGVHLLLDMRGQVRSPAAPNEIGAIERNP